MSVQLRQVANICLEPAIQAVAYGAAAMIVGNPIGALAGAAFGGILGVKTVCLNTLFKEAKGLPGKVSQLALDQLLNIGAAVAVWKLAAAYGGISMTFKAALLLTFTPVGVVAVFFLAGMAIHVYKDLSAPQAPILRNDPFTVPHTQTTVTEASAARFLDLLNARK